MNREIEKKVLITEIIDHIDVIQKRFQAEGEDEEKRWMMMQTSDTGVIEFLQVATVQMLHVLDAIGELEPTNGISISKQYNIPRGTVSKITRRLAEMDMILVEPLPHNKKEVLFRLTSQGKKIFTLHQQLHQHINQNVRHFLNQYQMDQMRFLLILMQEVMKTSWVEVKEKQDKPQQNESIPLPTNQVEYAQEVEEKNEIFAMLQQLDANKLNRAKQLIQIAFFDE